MVTGHEWIQDPRRDGYYGLRPFVSHRSMARRPTAGQAPACFLSSWRCLDSRRALRHRHGRKYRHPSVPISILLVSVRDLEHPGLGERAALDLKPDGQTFAVKPTRDAHGRHPHIVYGPRAGGDGAEGPDASRRAATDI